MNSGTFQHTDSMRSLIRENHSFLMLIRRFGISLGFGDASIGTVCSNAGIHTDTFLAVANFLADKPWHRFDIDIPSLMSYLRKAHEYFLGFSIPTIRRKLIEALPTAGPDDLTLLILKYFDDYAEEVRRHMDFENRAVFPYVEALLKGIPDTRLNIAEFEARHLPLAPKLQELKEIFVCHYQGSGNQDLLTSVLFDIITLEQDLKSHCAIEDVLFVPAVEAIEPPEKPEKPETAPTQGLSSRESEIVQCIARGLSTKEIAEKLFLSAHTITTHRRNICSKLDIHSAAGLTIYAIIHGLVDISEIKVQ